MEESQKELALTQLRKSVEKLSSSTEVNLNSRGSLVKGIHIRKSDSCVVFVMLFPLKGYEAPTLMRFLVARSMNPHKAAKMFVDWQKWRASLVPPNGITDSEVKDELDFRKVCLQGPTKSGHPMVLVITSKHFPAKDQVIFKSNHLSLYSRLLTFTKCKLFI